MVLNIGFGTIGAGQWQRWWYRINNGADLGPRYAMANPFNPGGELESHHQTKKKEGDGTITYWVWVRNIGSVTTNFNLQVGGLTGSPKLSWRDEK